MSCTTTHEQEATEVWESAFDSGLTSLSFERWYPFQRIATEADLKAEWERLTAAGETAAEYEKWRHVYLWRNGGNGDRVLV